VATGEICAARKGVIRAGALGSCVAVALMDLETGVGGMAHVMLPGQAPDTAPEPTRYAQDAISDLIAAMTDLGAQPDRLCAWLAGGGNVLERENDTVCDANIASVSALLASSDIPVLAAHLGGRLRRSLSLDLNRARVTFTHGDSGALTLWEAEPSFVDREVCR